MQQVDVQARRAGRVRTGELLDPHARCNGRRDARSGCLADVHGAVGELRETLHARGEVPCAVGEHEVRRRRVRPGVDRGDEDRLGRGSGRGDPAERSGAQRRPQARFQEQRADRIAVQRRDLASGERGEGDLPIGPIVFLDVDHDREEGPPLAAVHRGDATGGRRGVGYAVLVDEERLAAQHPVAGMHPDRCAQPDVVRGNERDARGRTRRLDLRRGRPGDREIETLPCSVHGHW